MKILAIDSGNTRIKWGYRDGDTWTRVGVLTHDESAGLAAALASLPAPDRIAIANVAGGGPARVIEAACAPFAKSAGAPLIWAQSRAAQCGVVNLYADAAQLGVDRWAALIGARQRHTGACLVVCAGTATTVDMLSSGGEFRGGVILPGLALMKQSLARNTAQLPFADGAYADEPRSTADAIQTGVLHAQAGAIERMHAQLVRSEGGGGVLCLISGGAAQAIAPCLAISHHLADHLVLDGLAKIAKSDA